MKKLTLSMAVTALIFFSLSINAQNVGIDVETPQQKLDVNGGIRIGNTDVPLAGTIRWNGNHFEGFNGDTWIILDLSTDNAWVDYGSEVYLQDTTDKVGIGITDPVANLDIYGTQAIRSADMAFTGNGPFHNLVVPDMSFIRITGPTADFDLTGVAGGYDGRILIFFNDTNRKLRIRHSDNNSLPENRIRCRNMNDNNIEKNGACTLIYHGGIQNWVLLAE